MNYNTLNSASLNSAAIRVIVGAVVASLISVSGPATAQRLAQPFVSSSTLGLNGIVANSAIRYAPAKNNSVGLSGDAYAIRQQNGTTSTNLSVTGQPLSYLVYRGAKANVYQDLTGSVAPHYFIVPPPVRSGTVSIYGASGIGYPTTRGYPRPGVIGLNGYAFSPTIRTCRVFEGVIGLDGFAIPANHLGYAAPGSFTISGTARGLRFANARAVINAGVQSETGVPSYNTAEGFSFGAISLSGKTNVKLNSVHLIEQQFDLPPISGSVVTRVRRQQVNPVYGSVYSVVEVLANENILRNVYPDHYSIDLTGPSIDTTREATPKQASGQIRLSGLAFVDIRKPAPNQGNLSVLQNAAVSAYVIRNAEAKGQAALNGTALDSIIRNSTCLPGAFGLSNTPLKTLLYSTPLPINGFVGIAGNSAYAIYTASGRVTKGQINQTVTARGAVMFTVTTNNIEVSGFAYWARVKPGYSIYDGMTITGETEGRLAIRGASLGGIAVTGETDGRLAIRGASLGGIAVTGETDGRLAIRGASSGGMAITGKTDATTNLYAKAPEERIMIVPSFGNQDYLHMMIIPRDNRSMIA